VRFHFIVCSGVIVGLIGCGESTGRMAFSGNVTVSGQPITGAIRYSPVDRGPMATASIENGKYRFTSETGPVPGDYDVIIESKPAIVKKGAAAEVITPQEWKVTRRVEAGSKIDADFSLEPVLESVAD
jgi:hypothetical protein